MLENALETGNIGREKELGKGKKNEVPEEEGGKGMEKWSRRKVNGIRE